MTKTGKCGLRPANRTEAGRTRFLHPSREQQSPKKFDQPSGRGTGPVRPFRAYGAACRAAPQCAQPFARALSARSLSISSAQARRLASRTGFCVGETQRLLICVALRAHARTKFPDQPGCTGPGGVALLRGKNYSRKLSALRRRPTANLIWKIGFRRQAK